MADFADMAYIGLKVGDLIKCADEDDCRKVLKELSDFGYGAVRASYDGHWIRITQVNG